MRRKRSKDRLTSREKLLMIVSIVAVASSVAMLNQALNSTENIIDVKSMDIEDLSTVGFVEVEVEAGILEDRGVVSLTGGCYIMTAGTDVIQAESIRNGLDGVVGPRPNTHDIAKDMFELLDIELVMVKITELRDNNFHGKVILQQGNTVLSLDSRPSDGMALALRTGSKIHFNETLLKEQGRNIC